MQTEAIKKTKSIKTETPKLKVAEIPTNQELVAQQTATEQNAATKVATKIFKLMPEEFAEV
jgi:hypothetical protein